MGRGSWRLGVLAFPFSFFSCIWRVSWFNILFTAEGAESGELLGVGRLGLSGPRFAVGVVCVRDALRSFSMTGVAGSRRASGRDGARPSRCLAVRCFAGLIGL